MYKLIVLSVLCLSLCTSLVVCKCERDKPTNLKTYIIDLDKAPTERFDEVTNDFKQQIISWINAEK